MAHHARLAMTVCLIASVLAGSGLFAKSIFDDDYQGDPEPMHKPAPPTPPPPPPPPRLAPTPPPPEPTPAPPTPPSPDTPAEKPARPALLPRPLNPPPRERLPLPDKAAIASAEKLIKNVFAIEYANTMPSGRAALARALMNEIHHGGAMAPAERYVLLREARAAGIAGGDLLDAIVATHGLRDSFNFSATAARDMERESLNTHPLGSVSASVVEIADARRASRYLMGCAERQLLANDYVGAAQIANSAEGFARHANDSRFAERVRARSLVLSTIAAEYVANKASFDILHSHPDDPAANAVVGRFIAFTLDQPERGMSLLAKGNDPLAKLARLELTAPADAQQQTSLAEAWAAQSKATTIPSLRPALLRRALFWYDAAIAQSGGLEKLTLEKKADALRSINLVHGLRADFFRGENLGLLGATRVDSSVEFRWDTLPPEEGIRGEWFSSRWTGWIKSPAAGQYTMLLVVDDAAKVWIDDDLVLEAHGGRATRPYRLTGAPQRLKIEYRQEMGAAYVGLGWIPPHGKRAVAVPADALFHDPFEFGPIEPVVPSAAPDGSIALESGHADLEGPAIDYRERIAGSFVLGDWNDEHASPSWTFDGADGDYDVNITYSCDGQAGSTYRVNVGNNDLAGIVQETGSWDRATTERLGRIHLVAGSQTLAVNVQAKPHTAVMNLFHITLTPVK